MNIKIKLIIFTRVNYTIHMKIIKLLITIVIISCLPILSFSQSKAEKKKLKQELKTYKRMKPMEIRSMKLNYENKLKDKNNQVQQAKQLQKRVDSLQTLLNSNTAKLSGLESQLLAAQAEAAGAKKGTAKGYYYRVQLGAYKFFDVNSKVAKDAFLLALYSNVSKSKVRISLPSFL